MPSTGQRNQCAPTLIDDALPECLRRENLASCRLVRGLDAAPSCVGLLESGSSLDDPPLQPNGFAVSTLCRFESFAVFQHDGKVDQGVGQTECVTTVGRILSQ